MRGRSERFKTALHLRAANVLVPTAALVTTRRRHALSAVAGRDYSPAGSVIATLSGSCHSRDTLGDGRDRHDPAPSGDRERKRVSGRMYSDHFERLRASVPQRTVCGTSRIQYQFRDYCQTSASPPQIFGGFSARADELWRRYQERCLRNASSRRGTISTARSTKPQPVNSRRTCLAIAGSSGAMLTVTMERPVPRELIDEAVTDFTAGARDQHRWRAH